MRAFIAIEVPEEINNFLIDIQNKIKGFGKLNFVKPPFHLTLKFLGEVSKEKIDLVKEKLKKIVFHEFDLQLDSLGVFPNKNYIRVIWVGINGNVKSLQQKIDKGLKGLFNEELNFHPHITLARVKSIENKRKAKEKIHIKIDPLGFKVNQFKLIKSELTPEGPHYSLIEVYHS